MRRLHGIALSSLTALVLSSAIPTLTPTANAAPALPVPPPSCPTGGVTQYKVIKKQASVLQTYFADDPALGPLSLPTQGPIGQLLRGYTPFQPLNDLGAGDFLSCFWPVKNDSRVIPAADEVKRGQIRFPEFDGFALLPNGKPDQTAEPVPVGTKLELFGNNVDGQFLAPENTPYSKLAIPPSNLDTFTNEFPFNYHLFLVCKVFHALQGPIAPWFEQPGGGTQDFIGNEKVSKEGTTIGALTKTDKMNPVPYLVDITKDSTKPCPSS